jgi:hypothetical protein
MGVGGEKQKNWWERKQKKKSCQEGWQRKIPLTFHKKFQQA